MRTTIIGRLGCDELSRFMLRCLSVPANLKLDWGYVSRDVSGVRTGVAVQLVAVEDGKKVTVVCSGANDEVGQVEVDKARRLLDKVDVGVVLLQQEVPLAANVQVAQEARRRGCLVALRPSPLPEGHVPRAHRMLHGMVDMVFVTEYEAPQLLGWDASRAPLRTVAAAEEAAAEMLERWPTLQLVVIMISVAVRRSPP